MGDINKLLIDINGMPMIRRTVQACLDACDGPVAVVTGHQAKAVQDALSGLGINCVFNPDFQVGQKTSVATGLAAAPDARATLVVLGDQPLLTAGNISWLLAQHRQQEDRLITVPMRDGARGNPLIVPHALKAGLLADKNNPGCQKFTRENPKLVHFVPATDPAFYTDIDTPEELKALLAREEHAA